MFLIQLLTLFDFKNGGFFGQLYENHHKIIYSYIYAKVRNHHDAEDLTTETFLEVWKTVDRFKEISESEIKSLMIKYARNNVADFYRKKQTRIQPLPLYTENDEGEEVQYEIPDNAQNPEILFENKQKYQRLIDHIENLSEEQREVLELKYRLGMSNKDISEILKLNVDVVNARIYRAKRTLEKSLSGGNV